MTSKRVLETFLGDVFCLQKRKCAHNRGIHETFQLFIKLRVDRSVTTLCTFHINIRECVRSIYNGITLCMFLANVLWWHNESKEAEKTYLTRKQNQTNIEGKMPQPVVRLVSFPPKACQPLSIRHQHHTFSLPRELLSSENRASYTRWFLWEKLKTDLRNIMYTQAKFCELCVC